MTAALWPVGSGAVYRVWCCAASQYGWAATWTAASGGKRNALAGSPYLHCCWLRNGAAAARRELVALRCGWSMRLVGAWMTRSVAGEAQWRGNRVRAVDGVAPTRCRSHGTWFSWIRWSPTLSTIHSSALYCPPPRWPPLRLGSVPALLAQLHGAVRGVTLPPEHTRQLSRLASAMEATLTRTAACPCGAACWCAYTHGVWRPPPLAA